jgi:hypothetical protein
MPFCLCALRADPHCGAPRIPPPSRPSSACSSILAIVAHLHALPISAAARADLSHIVCRNLRQAPRSSLFPMPGRAPHPVSSPPCPPPRRLSQLGVSAAELGLGSTPRMVEPGAESRIARGGGETAGLNAGEVCGEARARAGREDRAGEGEGKEERQGELRHRKEHAARAEAAAGGRAGGGGSPAAASRGEAKGGVADRPGSSSENNADVRRRGGRGPRHGRVGDEGGDRRS